MHLRYLVTDSILNYIPYDDTVNLVFAKEIVKSRKKQEKVQAEKNLGIALAVQNGTTLDLYKAISVIPENPVAYSDISKFKLLTAFSPEIGIDDMLATIIDYQRGKR